MALELLAGALMQVPDAFGTGGKTPDQRVTVCAFASTRRWAFSADGRVRFSFALPSASAQNNGAWSIVSKQSPSASGVLLDAFCLPGEFNRRHPFSLRRGGAGPPH